MKSLFAIIMTIQLVTGITGCGSGKPSSATIKWRIAASLPLVNGKQPGVAGASSGVHNEMMMVAGGANFPDTMPWLGGKKMYHNSVYAFRRSADSDLKSLDTIFKLHRPLAYAACVSTERGIVCAGGENDEGISSEVFMMKWDENNNGIAISMLPPLPNPVTNAFVTADGEIIYVAGGEMSDAVSDRFFSLDLKDTASSWTALAPLPYPVSHAVMVFAKDNQQKQIYLVGGRKRNVKSTSTFYKDVYAYDIVKDKWIPKAALPYALSAGTGIATRSSIFIFGGDKGETFHRTELLNGQIAAAVNPAEKQRLSKQKASLQSAHPGFSKEILQYHFATNEWTISGTIPYDVPVTTTVFRWEDDFIIPGGEIKAGVRTPNILAGKLIE
jgi:N-acetylneuraminate epimerase